MRKVKDRIAWSSSLLSKRPKKPKETDWFKRILDGLVADSHKLSDEVRQRVHKAAIVVAMAIGGGWSNFRAAFAVVKSTVLCPQAIGERLIELFSMCYLKKGTDRPMIDHRGDIVLAVEKLVGPMPEGDVRNYIVTTHQRRYAASAAFLMEHGITARQPMLISMEERQELRALMFAAKWGEAEGYFEKSWTVREDGSLEVGLHPTGKSHDARPDDVVLYQHHIDKADDDTRERDFARIEQNRTARRGDWYAFAQSEKQFHCRKCFGNKVDTHFVDVRHEGTIDMNDPQDRRFEPYAGLDVSKVAVKPRYRMHVQDFAAGEDSDCHQGYKGLVPLDSPTLVENQLRTRRVRARMGWEVRAYQLNDGVYSRISCDKEVLCSDGRIWKPEDENGNPEQDFFADPRQVLTWKDKESERWITIRRWNKLVMQKSMLEFKVPVGANELGYELYRHVRGRDITSAEAISYLHDKSVTVLRDSTFRRELEGMFLSAAEEKAYSHLSFFRKERGLGSESYPVIPGTTPCKRCDEKWGKVEDAVKATWNDKPHAYVCNSCGSEIWKFGVRIYVDAKYLPFVVKRDERITHYSAEFFGDWVRELLVQTKHTAVQKQREAMLADRLKKARQIKAARAARSLAQ